MHMGSLRLLLPRPAMRTSHPPSPSFRALSRRIRIAVMGCGPSLAGFLRCGIFLLIAFLACAMAQNTPTCQPLSQGYVACSSYITEGTPTFVPPEASLDYLETAARKYVNAAAYFIKNDFCYSLFVQLACQTWLRPCAVSAVDGNSTHLAYPVEPCRRNCLAYMANCSYYYGGQTGYPFGAGLYTPVNYTLPVTCDEWDFWADNPFWLDTPATHGNATYNCTDASYPTPPICQDPLSVDGNGNCAFTCPLPSLTDDQYAAAEAMQATLGWLSWLSTLFVIASYVACPKLRQFPRCMIPMAAVSAHIVAGAIVLPTLAGRDNIWCGGQTLFVKPDGKLTFDSYYLPDYTFDFSNSDLFFATPPCTFQGGILQFGFISATFWWTAIALNMALDLVSRGCVPEKNRTYRWTAFAVYCCAVHGTAAVLTVVPAAAGAIDFASGATYCFIREGGWQAGTWFAPVGFALLVGSCLFAFNICAILVGVVRLRKWKAVVDKWRIVAFILLFLILFVFIFAYNIQVETHRDEIDSGYSSYFRCLVDKGSAHCDLPEGVSNYDLVMLRGFAMSSLGLLLSMLFIGMDVLRFWWAVGSLSARAAWRRDPQGVMAAVRMFAHDTGVTTTGGSTVDSLSVTTVSDGIDEDDEDDDDDDGEERSSEGEESSQESSDKGSFVGPHAPDRSSRSASEDEGEDDVEGGGGGKRGASDGVTMRS